MSNQRHHNIDETYFDALWKTKQKWEVTNEKTGCTSRRWMDIQDDISGRYCNKGKRIAPEWFSDVYSCKRCLQSNANGLSLVWFSNILPRESYAGMTNSLEQFESNLVLIPVMSTSSSPESNSQPSNHQRLNNVTTCKISSKKSQNLTQVTR